MTHGGSPRWLPMEADHQKGKAGKLKLPSQLGKKREETETVFSHVANDLSRHAA